MESFQADWLNLRRPYDETARSARLARQFLDALPANSIVADVAAGSGHNALYLDSLGPRKLCWRLFDADAELLNVAQRYGFSNIATADLRGLPDIFADVQAVTVSAFFDLVSKEWLTAFIDHIPPMPMLFALTVNGVWDWSPGHSVDADIMAAFGADQRKEKDFGPALGPDAATALPQVLTAAGYVVSNDSSYWNLGSGDGAILASLVNSISEVVFPAVDAATVAKWRNARLVSISQAELQLVVGHVDVLAIPGPHNAS